MIFLPVLAIASHETNGFGQFSGLLFSYIVGSLGNKLKCDKLIKKGYKYKPIYINRITLY